MYAYFFNVIHSVQVLSRGAKNCTYWSCDKSPEIVTLSWCLQTWYDPASHYRDKHISRTSATLDLKEVELSSQCSLSVRFLSRRMLLVKFPTNCRSPFKVLADWVLQYSSIQQSQWEQMDMFWHHGPWCKAIPGTTTLQAMASFFPVWDVLMLHRVYIH